MTPPFPPPPSVAAGPDDCEFVGCASGCDAWAPHHVRLNGDSCRLCSSCVLLCNPDAFCSACLLLLSPGAYAAASQEPHVDFSPGPTAACFRCGVFVAHISCVAYPNSFVCPPCAAVADRRPFSYEYDLAGGGRRTLDGRSARVILAAALLAHESALRAAAAAREKAERSVREAAAARKQARAMLDAAFRAAEAEARDAKEQVTPSSTATATATATATELPKKKTLKNNESKKKTPKSNEANRDRDKLKFDAMQQPALAFAAAAAAAAASSMPLPIPSSRLDQNPVKQEAMPLPMPSSRLGQNQVKQDGRGSSDRAAKDDYRALFGTLQ